MNKPYTLNEKYLKEYKRKKEQLFIDNIVGLLEDLRFSEFYNHVYNAIESKNVFYNFENLNGKTYLKLLFDEYGDRGIALRPIFKNKSLSADIEKYLDDNKNINGIRVSDQINSYRLNIYCSDDLNTIILDCDDTGRNKTLIIKNKKEIINCNFEDFDYELWLLSTIGDYMYDFEENDKKRHEFKDIIGLMQDGVNKIVGEKYKDDICKPKFELSVMDYGENAKIVLSVEHMGLKFSEIIFPHKNICYNNGFNIHDEIRDLYNRTM